MAASRRAHTNEYSPEVLLPVSLSPQWATAAPTSSEPPIPAGRSGPSPNEVTAFSPGSWCTQELVYALQQWSFCFLWNSCDQTLLAFKARFSGGSSSHCQTPRQGNLMWCSELSLLWENFCDIIIFQFMGCPSGGYEIWSYNSCTPPAIPLWLVLCLWM